MAVGSSSGASSSSAARAAPVSAAASAPATRPEPVAASTLPAPASFVEVVALFDQKREAKLAALLKRQVRLVRFSAGMIEFNPGKGAPSDLAGQVGKMLTQWTGQRWVVSVVNAAGAPTLHDQDLDQAKADPVVKSILEAFPGATVDAIRRADPET